MSKSLVKPNPKKCVFVIRPALRQKRVFVQLIKCSISLVPPVCTKPHQSNVLLRNKCSHCSLDIVQWTSNNWHDLCNTIFCIKTMKDCSRSLKGSFISPLTRGGRQKSWQRYLSAWKWMKVGESGWKWMKMDVSGWKWMKWIKVDASGWKCMKVGESGYKLMKVGGSGWKWMKFGEGGRKWVEVGEMDESGWKWMKVDEMDESGWK